MKNRHSKIENRNSYDEILAPLMVTAGLLGPRVHQFVGLTSTRLLLLNAVCITGRISD